MNLHETTGIRELKAEEVTRVSGGTLLPTPAMLAKIFIATQAFGKWFESESVQDALSNFR